MNDWNEVSYKCKIKALEADLADFRSGELYLSLRKNYEQIISEKDREIERLKKERDSFSFSRRRITEKWLDVIADVDKEHQKEIKALKDVIMQLIDINITLKNNYDEMSEKYKQKNHEYYDTAAKLDDANGVIQKLQAQVNHNYENSSLPSSKCINRKKITNNRERTGKKPGAQPGHKHHPRRKLTPTEVKVIPPDDKFSDTGRYVPTGKTITKQVIGITVQATVTEYRTEEFYDRKTGHNVHAKFPDGVTDDVNYDGSLKAAAFMLNNYCNVSLEKTSGFISDLTNGELRPSVGMINGLCHEFSEKSREEQDAIFKSLLDAPVIHADGTTVRVNGENKQVFVCCIDGKTMYFARESKGHEGVKGTPVETFGGIIVHDHDKTYYNYGSDHQECMVHILRYLKDSIENEPNLTWNSEMHSLIQEMIHEVNISENKIVSPEKAEEFSRRYDEIVMKAENEYADEPPGDYYRDGYNLYRRMKKYKHNHLLFLENPNVDADNNLSERKARIIKGKCNQAISLRSFEHLEDYCDCLSVMDNLRENNFDSIYDSMILIFQNLPNKNSSHINNTDNSTGCE